jgi:hypothetical protein
MVVLDAFHTIGLTNVEMGLEGPGGPVRTTWKGITAPSFHWQWNAVLEGEGVYRATFRADPGAQVYGVGYFAVTARSDLDAGRAESDGGVLLTLADAGRTAPDSGRGTRNMDGPPDPGGVADGGSEVLQEPNDTQGGCACRSGSAAAPLISWILLAGGVFGWGPLRRKMSVPKS